MGNVSSQQAVASELERRARSAPQSTLEIREPDMRAEPAPNLNSVGTARWNSASEPPEVVLNRHSSLQCVSRVEEMICFGSTFSFQFSCKRLGPGHLANRRQKVIRGSNIFQTHDRLATDHLRHAVVTDARFSGVLLESPLTRFQRLAYPHGIKVLQTSRTKPAGDEHFHVTDGERRYAVLSRNIRRGLPTQVKIFPESLRGSAQISWSETGIAHPSIVCEKCGFMSKRPICGAAGPRNGPNLRLPLMTYS
jgi:hypothetical protein